MNSNTQKNMVEIFNASSGKGTAKTVPSYDNNWPLISIQATDVHFEIRNCVFYNIENDIVVSLSLVIVFYWMLIYAWPGIFHNPLNTSDNTH